MKKILTNFVIIYIISIYTICNINAFNYGKKKIQKILFTSLLLPCIGIKVNHEIKRYQIQQGENIFKYYKDQEFSNNVKNTPITNILQQARNYKTHNPIINKLIHKDEFSNMLHEFTDIEYQRRIKNHTEETLNKKILREKYQNFCAINKQQCKL
jgi:hypothetical protein